MPRYHIKIEYDGKGLYGLQRQDGYPTIQDYIEKAIFAFSGEKTTLFAAGRTDAGVHALQMSAHFDCKKTFSPHTILMASHAHMASKQVRIVDCEIVNDDFHARFDAVSRHYLYRILNRPAVPVLERGRVWHISKPLNLKAMEENANFLIGHHDFTSFRASECQAPSPFKTLDNIDFSRQGEEIHIRFRAKSFLHHMVRNIVGTLVLYGKEKATPPITEILIARDRTKAGPTAPADGLYFIKADYK